MAVMSATGMAAYHKMSGDEGPEHLVIGRHAGGAHRGHRHAVIGVEARDDLRFLRLVFDLPVIPREFERRLVRLGTRGREIHGGGTRVGLAYDPFGEVQRRLT